MSVLVLIPVLNRPHRVDALIENFVTQTDEAQLMFLVSASDEAEREALRTRSNRMRNEVTITPWTPGPGDYARKINLGYKLSEREGYGWVFTGADDLTFHQGWLDEALAQAVWSGRQVVGTNDLWNPSVRRGAHSTHTLVAVDYVRDMGGGWDGPGVLLHEGYDHQCVDNELVTAAKMRDQWTFAPRSIVEHLHPFAKKAPMDSTYEKALAQGRADIMLFQQRHRNANAQAKARRPR